jgi:leucyl aminopeptidase (aminopeptidase T)
MIKFNENHTLNNKKKKNLKIIKKKTSKKVKSATFYKQHALTTWTTTPSWQPKYNIYILTMFIVRWKENMVFSSLEPVISHYFHTLITNLQHN